MPLRFAVEGGGHAEAAEQALEQVEIAFGGFGEEKLGRQDFAGGVVLHAENGEARAAALQPVVRGAVELHELAFASDAQTALAMSGSAALAGRADAGPAEQTTQCFAAEAQAFDFVELFGQMMVVEAGIFGACQTQNVLALLVGQATVAGPAPVGVSQRRLPTFAPTLFQALNVSHAQGEQLGGAGTRHLSLHASGNDRHSLQLLLTQRECLLSHGVTFSRCR